MNEQQKRDDEQKCTIAIQNNDMEEIERICKSRNLCENDDYIPFIHHIILIACITGQIKVLKYLVEELGTDYRYGNDTPLRNAADFCLYFCFVEKQSKGNHFDIIVYLISLGADINVLSNNQKRLIFGPRIWEFYKRQKQRKRLISIRNQLVPIYYHPQMKGGYFAKKDLMNMIDEI